MGVGTGVGVGVGEGVGLGSGVTDGVGVGVGLGSGVGVGSIVGVGVGVGVTVGEGEGGGVGDGVGISEKLTAVSAFTSPQPKLLSRPVVPKSLAVLSSACRTSVGEETLPFASTRAATPATCGVAIEVPWKNQ